MDLVIGKVPGQTSQTVTQKKQNEGGSFPLNPNDLYVFCWALFRHGVFFCFGNYLQRIPGTMIGNPETFFVGGFKCEISEK